MEQVKAGGHKDDDTLDWPSRKLSFQKPRSLTEICKCLCSLE